MKWAAMTEQMPTPMAITTLETQALAACE